MADERIYVVPFSDAYEKPRTVRARRALKILKEFVARHMKVDEENVRISEPLNALVWERGMQKPPRRIKIRVRVEDGKALAALPTEKVEKKGEKEAKEKKTDEKKPEEKVKEEEEKTPEQRKKEEQAEKVLQRESMKERQAEKVLQRESMTEG